MANTIGVVEASRIVSRVCGLSNTKARRIVKAELIPLDKEPRVCQREHAEAFARKVRDRDGTNRLFEV